MATIGMSSLTIVGQSATAGEVTITPRRRRTPWEWFVTTGWRHLVGVAVCVVAVFPLLYVISTSLSASGTLTG